MNLNHIHIGTKDLLQSRRFYEDYFGFRKKFDHGSGVFLTNPAGFLIAIDPVDQLPELPSWFHFGFCLDDPKTVKTVYDRMKAGGVRFAKDYQEYGADAVSFFCFDPDGYKFEVSWHRE
jgi:catechol 2,3-dioxygenase-like lactoylglutathione lyase family enzyme